MQPLYAKRNPYYSSASRNFTQFLLLKTSLVGFV